MFSRLEVKSAEQAAAAAWPARESVDVLGWRVRRSGGGTRRANSVLPLDFSGHDLQAAIDRVETLYRSAGTTIYFQVSSISEPAGLDQALAARGYRDEEPCLLMLKRLDGANSPSAPASVTRADTPPEAWLSIYTEPLDATRRAAAPGVLATVPSPRAFFLAERDGRPLATALGVAVGAVAVVECVATRSDARRSGGASKVMDALEAWAIARRCTIAALQVVAANTPACTLYRRRGYSEAGRYHYRWKHV
jgi:GNAT superfamily N-acetyltransferase